jgi:hypothetical protein
MLIFNVAGRQNMARGREECQVGKTAMAAHSSLLYSIAREKNTRLKPCFFLAMNVDKRTVRSHSNFTSLEFFPIPRHSSAAGNIKIQYLGNRLTSGRSALFTVFRMLRSFDTHDFEIYMLKIVELSPRAVTTVSPALTNFPLS